MLCQSLFADVITAVFFLKIFLQYEITKSKKYKKHYPVHLRVFRRLSQETFTNKIILDSHI